LLTVTSGAGKPCAAGCWLLQLASQRLSATTINRARQVSNRVVDMIPFTIAGLNQCTNCKCMGRFVIILIVYWCPWMSRLALNSPESNFRPVRFKSACFHR
jgi:hypothetical protein